jgi:RNA polymerase sigma-70 factor (ECF subfamily)
MVDDAQLQKIVTDCQAGSENAFSRLVDIYATRCYGYFYRATGNSAVSNDLLSELFMKLVERIGSFKGGSFEKWLFTVASNIFRDYLRRQYRQKKLLKAKADELAIQPTPKGVDTEISDQLQIQLAKLDPDIAELIVLRFYGQLSFKELAEIRSEPIGTTLSKVHRGLKKLRELMGTGDG